MKDEMTDIFMDTALDGGEVALGAAIKTMEDLMEKVGDQNMPLSGFIEMLEDFKGFWVESIKISEDGL